MFKDKVDASRRRFTASLAAGIAAPAVLGSQAYAASKYPNRPIRLLVPYTPGGVSDVSARIVAEALSRQFNQSVVVENRPGAAGLISAEAIVHAAPDGYMIMLGNNGQIAINPFIVPKLPYDTLKDLAAVGRVGEYPSVLAVNPAVAAHSWKDVYDLSLKTPEGLLYGMSGVGSTDHLLGELLARTSKAHLVPVPYKGAGPALTDAVAGHIPLSLTSLAGGLPMIKAKQLRAIAVSGEKRNRSAPDIPTFTELGVPVVANSWIGLIAPGATPKPVIDTLNNALNAALEQAHTRQALYDLGVDATPRTPRDFQREVASDLAKYGPVVKAAGIKVSL